MPPVASPIDWAVIEDALYDWIIAAIGIATIWQQQDSPQPPYPYATLNVTSGPLKVAGQDEQRWSFDAGEPLGEEVGVEVAGLREMTVSCQVFVRQDASTPASHARNLMTRAQSSLGLPSVLAAFQLAGLSVVEEGVVQNISEAVEDTWIARAMMDVRFGLAASIEERTGYIKTVKVQPDFGPADDALELEVTIEIP